MPRTVCTLRVARTTCALVMVAAGLGVTGFGEPGPAGGRGGTLARTEASPAHSTTIFTRLLLACRGTTACKRVSSIFREPQERSAMPVFRGESGGRDTTRSVTGDCRLSHNSDVTSRTLAAVDGRNEALRGASRHRYGRHDGWRGTVMGAERRTAGSHG